MYICVQARGNEMEWGVKIGVEAGGERGNAVKEEWREQEIPFLCMIVASIVTLIRMIPFV